MLREDALIKAALRPDSVILLPTCDPYNTDGHRYLVAEAFVGILKSHFHESHLSDGPYIADKVFEYFWELHADDHWRQGEMLKGIKHRMSPYSTKRSLWTAIKSWFRKPAEVEPPTQVERWERGEASTLSYDESISNEGEQ